MGNSGSVSPELAYDPEQPLPGRENGQLVKEEPGPTCWDRCKSCLQRFLRWCLCCRAATAPEEGFSVRIRTSGKTGGCERQFVHGVSRILSKQSVTLSVEETPSKDFLLLMFCPIASRIGTDMENALEGLSGDQKTILVVMHYIQKDNTETFLDSSWQGRHPALLRTVHTRYTLREGFYPCEMNRRATNDVASIIKDLAEDH